MRAAVKSFTNLALAAVFAIALLFSGALPPASAQAAPASSDEVQAAKTWVEYDGYNYKTKVNCEAQLKRYRAAYPDMHLSNTKCSAVKLQQWPPRTVYRIYIIDPSAGSRSTASGANDGAFILAC